MNLTEIFKPLSIIVLSIGGIANVAASDSCRPQVTLESLLKEMVSPEEQALYPDPPYRALQESSHDRASVSPDEPGWFANNDGFGIIRTDTIDGRYEKVLFDEQGPGVITRIWITTLDKRGTWRFYFDGSSKPGWVIPAYDLMRLGVEGVGRGLLQAHTSYEPEGKGGNTLFLPIPYAKGCKITFEDEPGVNPTPKYYHINFRRYPANTDVETFSAAVAARAKEEIAAADGMLLNPLTAPSGKETERKGRVEPGKGITLKLPKGEKAVYQLNIAVEGCDTASYGEIMRNLILCAEFDGRETVRVPLSDFSGGGAGAPEVKSWYLTSDGSGNVTSRWLMPYRKKGAFTIENLSGGPVEISLSAVVSPLEWDDDRSLYFHASWRKEDGIYIHNRPEEEDRCQDWNFATITGRGVYKGDLLSLYNHAPLWYGEGDEKIYVDNESFPSHFGTGTEDYYNSSWAPVVPFHTPFGGAPRADSTDSHGYNAFYRTRHLDGIPFDKKFRFDIEMLGWEPGTADYATTIYWYGDGDANASGVIGR